MESFSITITITSFCMDRKEKVLQKFGKRLTLLRKEKDLTTRELAASAGLEYRQVLQIEAGKTNLLFTTIMALCKGLEVTPDKLFEALD
ncbi:MAG TPA: helix-turn-helix transcriptional regulator [Puia sp.]|nr:helix-turn-helix transcriptional regulator [Puia sp.]